MPPFLHRFFNHQAGIAYAQTPDCSPLKAVAIYTRAAKAKVPEGLYRLGMCYAEGRGVPHDPGQAFLWMEKAADAGYAPAKTAIARLYLDGMKSSSLFSSSRFLPDPVKALQWAQDAAKAGDPQGDAIAGYLLSNGPNPDPVASLDAYRRAAKAGIHQAQLGVGLALIQQPDKRDEAIAALQAAAASDNGYAMFVLGTLHTSGEGLDQDYPKAFSLYHRAAEMGIRPAMAKLGAAMLFGQGTQKDLLHGETWLRRAANAGDTEACAILGDHYANPEDGLSNYPEAMSWYLRGAELGHLGAAYALGDIYCLGRHGPTDMQSGLHWIEQAAKDGYAPAVQRLRTMARDGVAGVPMQMVVDGLTAAAKTDPAAALELGMLYVLGRLGDEGMTQARHWFAQAPLLAPANFMLAQLYLQGHGGPVDLERGRMTMAVAAQNGVLQAQAAYAELCLMGVGGPLDHEEALRWYRQAADGGLIDAMFSTGAMLGGGHQVSQNRAVARQYYERAALAGHGRAMWMLGLYLKYGYGGHQDAALSRQWLERARDLGVEQAAQELASTPQPA